jgi:hypothetical protein
VQPARLPVVLGKGRAVRDGGEREVRDPAPALLGVEPAPGIVQVPIERRQGDLGGQWIVTALFNIDFFHLVNVVGVLGVAVLVCPDHLQIGDGRFDGCAGHSTQEPRRAADLGLQQCRRAGRLPDPHPDQGQQIDRRRRGGRGL